MVLKTLNLEGPELEPHQLKGDPHHLAPLLRGVIAFAKPERILDATAGSGVTCQVADDLAIPCTSSDLHDPSGGTDLFGIDDEQAYDLVVYHPDIWCARDDATHPHDLGAKMPYDSYVDLNVDAIEHLAGTLRPTGHLMLVAPIARRHGRVRSLARDLQCLFGSPKEPELVHAHPHCRSRGTMYGRKFIPIAHDQVVLWTREEILEGKAATEDEAAQVGKPKGQDAAAAKETHGDAPALAPKAAE